MKTQIIRLEAHDDVISVKDKMEWAQTPRILLVWPRRGKILRRRLDLVFLQRYSVSLGAQLALVSQDPDVCYHAKNLNILVYPTIRNAEGSHWRKSRSQRRKVLGGRKKIVNRKKKSAKKQKKTLLNSIRETVHPKSAGWISHPLARVILFTLGVLGVLAIGAILVPSAEIYLTPETQTQNITIPVAASSKFQVVDLGGKVPARTVSVTVEGRDSIDSTGNIYIPDQAATGTVIFTNLTDHEVRVPVGTVVNTIGAEQVAFSTTQDGIVPANGESEPIGIVADSAGIVGNVPAGAIVAIEGPLGLNLTVSNSEKILGGTGRMAPAPLKGDYIALYERLLGELYQSAILELETNLAAADLLLATDAANYTLIEETYTPAEIQPADQLLLTLRVAYDAQIASGDDLKELGRAVLEANLPDHYVSAPETIDINHRITSVSYEDDLVEWQMDVGWQIRATIDSNDAIRQALWQSPDEAVAQLYENLPLAESPQIRMIPSWWPRLPILPFRVKVIVNP